MVAVNSHTQARLKEADRFLRMRVPDRCADICASVLQDSPGELMARLMLARARQMQGRFDDMLDQLIEARAHAKPTPLIELMLSEAFMAMGAINDARNTMDALYRQVQNQDPALLGRIAEVQTQLGDHETALATLKTALALSPDDLQLKYGLASAELACGDLEAAERHLDDVIARAPGDFDAAYNRATLRKQTHDHNHVDALKAQLWDVKQPGAEFALCYALAKELEDLGEYDDSFTYLERGAQARRKRLQYNVETDLQAMADIARAFDETFFAKPQADTDASQCVFVLGLPRSGTTLIERILASHGDVVSVGEVNDFAMALTRYAGGGGAGKTSLIQNALNADHHAMGLQYRQATTQRARSTQYVIDKTPLNFLYIGLIAKALPGAKIIHVHRDEMDVGSAMYKTLFRMGYPFSYDLTDIGRYICAKAKLMAHWQSHLGDQIVNVSYDALINDPEGESRRLVASLGLDWDERCLQFHKNRAPSATASAVQVRQPIYASSVNKWRHYAKHLDPLSQSLSNERQC